MKLLAIRYDRQASERRAAGDISGAIRLYEKAVRHAPEWSVPWYNLGLTHKYEQNWSESYRCNAEAIRLNPEDEAAVWNMGIAATALGNWSEARRAWRLCGIAIPEDVGPIDMNFGTVPIRIDPNDTAEVVWARRIDPARAVIRSIPLPESNHRHGDLVLHDGVPVGYRMLGEQEVPVFNELDLLAGGHNGTFEIGIEASAADDLVAFEQACEEVGCVAEDWSTVRKLCRECSEGRPHAHPQSPVEGEHRFAVAAPAREMVEKAIAIWRTGHHDRTTTEIVTVMNPVAVQ